MLRDAWLIAAKDLRIEWRSRVATNQVAPFAFLILVLFAFALDANSAALREFTPGLFWVAVLFSGMLAIQRSFSIESSDGVGDALLLSGIEPASMFLGKALAIFLQLLALEVILAVAVLVLYDAGIEDGVLFATTSLVAAAGVAAAGTLYGVLSVNLRVKETILPLLLLPVLAPVLIGATRAFNDALGTAAVDGWAWLGVLGLFAVIYIVFGSFAYGVLLEDS